MSILSFTVFLKGNPSQMRYLHGYGSNLATSGYQLSHRSLVVDMFRFYLRGPQYPGGGPKKRQKTQL